MENNNSRLRELAPF